MARARIELATPRFSGLRSELELAEALQIRRTLHGPSRPGVSALGALFLAIREVSCVSSPNEKGAPGTVEGAVRERPMLTGDVTAAPSRRSLGRVPLDETELSRFGVMRAPALAEDGPPALAPRLRSELVRSGRLGLGAGDARIQAEALVSSTSSLARAVSKIAGGPARSLEGLSPSPPLSRQISA
jgi:hypothetical protein